MQIAIIVIAWMGILFGLCLLLIPTKVKKIDTDFQQLKIRIEETLNHNELSDCNYSVDEFFDDYENDKQCFKYLKKIKKIQRDQYSLLLINQFKHTENINEPSK